MDKLITKSSYLRGTRCTKCLFLDRYKPELRDPLSDSEQKRINDGIQVGILARDLFPGGKLSVRDNKNPVIWASTTKGLIQSGEKIIYEAGFIHDDGGIFCGVDILIQDGDAWQILEVKSTTDYEKHSAQYIEDAAIQYYIVTGAGYKVSDVSIVYLNKRYSRQGELDLQKLFTIKSVLMEVKSKQDSIKGILPILKFILSSKEVPNESIGMHCHTPEDCDFMSHCWKDVPENSVFDIAGLTKKKKFALYEAGKILLKDIPEDFELSENQLVQVNGKDKIDKQGIKSFLSEFSYPVYYFDIETMNFPIPMFNISNPYRRIGFQWSLHYKQSKKSEVKHTEFLAEPKGDPRPAFIRKFLSSTETTGTILVFNIGFESSVLKEIAEDFPEYKEKIEERISRMIDLADPFRKKLYYKKEMRGSFSIKQVLPAVVPGYSYKDLDIQDGLTASNLFESLYKEQDKKKIEQTLVSLKKYCFRDTESMVKILEALEKAVK